MFTHIVVHYGEIALKGKNRPDFENRLVENIKLANSFEKLSIERQYGRILIRIDEEWKMNDVMDSLKIVFGIANFSPCVVCKNDLEEMKSIAVDLAKNVKDIKSFRICTIRSNKNFPSDSPKLNIIIGDAVNRHTGWSVDLKNPDLTIYVEVGEKCTMVYTKKYTGPGGLPVGVTGKVVCLLSGGIDSPVASWYMMKRGCEVIFVHFHTYTSKIESKIENIVTALNKYQYASRIYYVPFFDVQERIIENVVPEFRIVVFRKFMTRFAEEIIKKEGANAIVTGDNIAQVASQTLENLKTIYSGAKYPIIAPLAGFDKREIVEVAKSIGTYDLSNQKYQDCCSSLVAKHPNTRSEIENISEIEKIIDVEKLVEDIMKKLEIVDIKQ